MNRILSIKSGNPNKLQPQRIKSIEGEEESGVNVNAISRVWLQVARQFRPAEEGARHLIQCFDSGIERREDKRHTDLTVQFCPRPTESPIMTVVAIEKENIKSLEPWVRFTIDNLTILGFTNKFTLGNLGPFPGVGAVLLALSPSRSCWKCQIGGEGEHEQTEKHINPKLCAEIGRTCAHFLRSIILGRVKQLGRRGVG